MNRSSMPPEHIRAVEGQRFVVLRPNHAITKAHHHLQIRVLKTAELLDALSGLRLEASQRRLTIDTAIPLQDWIFHMSVAYCSDLGNSAWNDVMKLSKELEIPPASCHVNEIEVVAFDNLRESLGGAYALAQARQAP